ncbi:metallophosphoesterase, partial [Paenibacillus alba]|nr:metallophosphoesterase [Paenibacillus alba]
MKSNVNSMKKPNRGSFVIRILLFMLLVLLLHTYAWEATATAPAKMAIAAAPASIMPPLPLTKNASQRVASLALQNLTAQFQQAKQATPATAPLFSFSVLSDVHVGAKDTDSQKRFRAALADHMNIRPDSKLMVLNGDLTNGINNDYKSLFNIMYEFKLPPVHATMGNHEYYGLWETKQEDLDTSRLSTDWSSGQAINSFEQMFNYKKPYHELDLDPLSRTLEKTQFKSRQLTIDDSCIAQGSSFLIPIDID